MSAPRSLLLLLPLLLSAAARAQATMGFQDGVSPTPAYAGTRDLVLIEPDTDSRFDPNANYDSLQCAVDGYASRQVALLRWDVSALTPGSTVSAASIKVNVTNVSNNPYEIHELLRPWVASEATFFLSRAGTPWGAAGASASSDHAAPVLGTMTGDVGSRTFPLTAAGLAAVQRWIDLPAANDGVIVRDYTQENGFEFSSSEDSVLANRPTLSVTYGGVTTEFRQGSAPTAAYAGASDTTLAWGPRTGGNLNGRGLALAGGTQTGHVLLSFDLSALPSNATVSAATLTLRISNTGPGSFPLYEALRPWTETGATWTTYDGTTPWASTGVEERPTATNVLGTVSPSAVGLLDVPLTAAGVQLVQDWVRGVKPNRGMIAVDDAAPTDALLIDDREVASVTNRPRLTVTFTAPGFDGGTDPGDAGATDVDGGGGGFAPLALRVGCACGEAGWGLLPLSLAAWGALARSRARRRR